MKDKYKALAIVLMFSLIISMLNYTSAQPSGANITNISTETKTPAPAEYINTSGGTFTTLILYSETQNLRWKAYAGNVTGVLTLDDSGDYSIYQWSLTDITGEVYATRTNNSISWASIQCANETHIYNEEIALNHTTDADDSINSTFSYQIHRPFTVGIVPIPQSQCRSTFTWINNSPQTPAVDAPFTEVLLYDSSYLIYTTFIDDNTQGFNYNDYDFQMIVPERGVAGYPNERYYFYMELGG